MSHRIRTALIGAGHISKQHLACLRELPGVEVVGVCDLSRAAAEAAAERFGVAAWFTDHTRMLAEAAPEVVHVTTPPMSHFPLAIDALDAGSHVILEKPATVHYHQLTTLLERASLRRRVLIEDYNYIFNKSVQEVLRLIAAGDFGEVVHVEVLICVDNPGKGSPFVASHAPPPMLAPPGGAIADFLPHLASLAHAFVGRHRSIRVLRPNLSGASQPPGDEFRALVEAERGTAMLGFSARARPEVFWLRVYGTRMTAVANLWETRLTIDRLRAGPRSLLSVRNALQEARDVRRAAYSSLRRKFASGIGAYEGLWELLARTYAALGSGAEPPISMRQIDEVNRLVAALTAEEASP